MQQHVSGRKKYGARPGAGGRFMPHSAYGILARPKRRKKAIEMTTYKELQAQIEQLRKQAEELRQAEIADVITEIKTKMQEYGITGADLGLMGKKRVMKTSPAMADEAPAMTPAAEETPAASDM
ncbi:H-NS histone family protein [Collimonas humicola]|uniref:H-NS histone family protein n=1 Tax=Collimonas humicola TaxID=2825886 RepID=UPI001E3F8E10|nr:H-NS histone family protein [Collimonas humicola]